MWCWGQRQPCLHEHVRVRVPTTIGVSLEPILFLFPEQLRVLSEQWNFFENEDLMQHPQRFIFPVAELGLGYST